MMVERSASDEECEHDLLNDMKLLERTNDSPLELLSILDVLKALEPVISHGTCFQGMKYILRTHSLRLRFLRGQTFALFRSSYPN
jgi:hypothetical protein